MKRVLFLLLCVAPTILAAQNFKLAVGAGYGASNVYYKNSPFDPAPGPVFSISGSRVMRRIEVGLKVRLQTLAGRSEMIYTQNGIDPTGKQTVYYNFGKPAIATVLFANYLVKAGKGSIHIGPNVGVLLNMKSTNKGGYQKPGDVHVGYESTTGITAGIQGGYSHPVTKRVAIGLEAFYNTGSFTIKVAPGAQPKATLMQTGVMVTVGYSL